MARSVVLIGMLGSGKTTLGLMVAAATQRVIVDTAGNSIPII